jgi:hypothetical protein
MEPQATLEKSPADSSDLAATMPVRKTRPEPGDKRYGRSRITNGTLANGRASGFRFTASGTRFLRSLSQIFIAICCRC